MRGINCCKIISYIQAMMYICAFAVALVVVLTLMFGQDERDPKRYIEMN